MENNEKNMDEFYIGISYWSY